jgi:hypothetical protein
MNYLRGLGCRDGMANDVELSLCSLGSESAAPSARPNLAAVEARFKANRLRRRFNYNGIIVRHCDIEGGEEV